jgi:hypothetical protein
MDPVDFDRTPRPNKRQRDDEAGQSTPVFAQPVSDDASDSASMVSSHHSGRMSPSKQLHALKDAGEPVRFLDLDNAQTSEPDDVAVIAEALESLGNGHGVLGWEEEETRAMVEGLSRREQTRFLAPAARNTARKQYGGMPNLSAVRDIVDAAHENNRDDADGDTWNTEVHHKLIELALQTSKHRRSLTLLSVCVSFPLHPSPTPPRLLTQEMTWYSL